MKPSSRIELITSRSWLPRFGRRFKVVRGVCGSCSIASSFALFSIRLSDEVENQTRTHASGVLDRFCAARQRRAYRCCKKVSRRSYPSARYAGVLGAFLKFEERAQGHGKTKLNLIR